MHVGLNLVYLVPDETGGMETYARELLPALVAAAPEETRFTAFLSREAAAERDAPWSQVVRSVVVPVHARRRQEWVVGEQWHIPRLARREGIDLLHSLASTAPARGPFARVTTIHDLNYRFAGAHFGLRAAGMWFLVPLAARRSDRIIAISRQTCDDLVRHLRVPREKIDVVYQGVSTARPPDALSEHEARRRFRLEERPVVLSPSAKRPHKNLSRLLQALSSIPPHRRPVVVIPGYRTPYEDELRSEAVSLGVAGDVRFLGWLPAGELEGLYETADCVVFPSLHEGFGLPILEAMARGIPVACSGTGALAEIAGDAALLFDPTSPRAIADAISRLLAGGSDRERLQEAGPARAATFSWERTARDTLAVYAKTEPRRTPKGPLRGPGSFSDLR